MTRASPSASTTGRTRCAPSSSTRRTGAWSGRACSTIRAATRACCSIRSSRIWRGRILPTTSRGCASSVAGALEAADARSGVLARSRHRHRRGHDRARRRCRSTRRRRPLALRSAVADQPRRARLAVEGPHVGRGGGGDHRDRGARTRRNCSRRSAAPIRPSGGGRRSGTACKVAPDVFDAAASWVELADFVPAVLAGVDDSDADRPLHLRRRAQGDVLRRVGRPAAEGVPRAARSEARRRCATGCTTRRWPPGTPAGHAERRSGRATFGLRAGHRDRDGRLRRALRRRRLGRPHRHAREDHRHLDLRLRDRAGRRRRSPTSPASAASSTARSCRAIFGIEAGQSAVGDLLKWWVEGVCEGDDALHAELSAEAARARAGRVGAGRARLEQRQPHDPRRHAADRPDSRPDAAHDARRDLSRADRGDRVRRARDHRAPARVRRRRSIASSAAAASPRRTTCSCRSTPTSSASRC